VCLVGVKIIFPENNFFILHRLVKEEGENYFSRKIDFPHLKEIIFLKKLRKWIPPAVPTPDSISDIHLSSLLISHITAPLSPPTPMLSVQHSSHLSHVPVLKGILLYLSFLGRFKI